MDEDSAFLDVKQCRMTAEKSLLIHGRSSILCGLPGTGAYLSVVIS